MSFKVGKVTTVTRNVKANVPINDGSREETMRVTFNIQAESVELANKNALIADKSQNVELDWLKKYTVKSVEGPEYMDDDVEHPGGGPMSIEDVIDIGFLRYPIMQMYFTTSQGLKTKN